MNFIVVAVFLGYIVYLAHVHPIMPAVYLGPMMIALPSTILITNHFGNGDSIATFAICALIVIWTTVFDLVMRRQYRRQECGGIAPHDNKGKLP